MTPKNVTAKIDQLDRIYSTNTRAMEKEKESNILSSPVPRLAAMFDGEFSIDWIEELTGMRASLILSDLEELVQQGILTRKTPATYLAINGQKQKEWADQMTADEKENCHRSIANILIRELSDNDSKVVKVSLHLLQVSNDLKGCQLLFKAGEIYSRSFSRGRANDCFAKILHDLSGQRGEDEDLVFIKAAIEYSNNFARGTPAHVSLSLLQEARGRAQTLGAQLYELLLDMHIAKYEWINFEFNKAIEHFEQAFSKVKGLGDHNLTAEITMFSAYFLFWQGRFKDVIEIYEKSVPDVEKYPVGHFPIVASIIAGHCYALTGHVTQGLGMLDAIRDYCLQGDDQFVAAHAGCGLAMVMLSINQVEDAIRYLKSALKDAKSSGNDSAQRIATLTLAYAFFVNGDREKSLQYMRKFLNISTDPEQVNLLLYPYLLEICLSMEKGDFPRIPDLSLERLMNHMLSVKNSFTKGIAYRYQALFGKWKGLPHGKVTQLLGLSAKWLERSGNQIDSAITQLELTRHYLSIGNERKSRKALQTAAEILSPSNRELIPDDLRSLLENQSHEGTVLREVLSMAHDMVVNQNEKRLLQQIVASASRITGAERGALLLSEDETHRQGFQLRASKNITADEVNDPGFVSSRGILEEVFTSGEGRIFEAGRTEDPSLSSKEMVRSSICVPVRLGKKIIGALYHENRILGKPFDASDLQLLSYFAALATLALDGERAHQEIERLSEKDQEDTGFHETDYVQAHPYEGIIGTSPAIQQILAQVDQIAKTDTTVLVLGETGVGKNLAAEAIHRQSLRRDGPFITVQCSALTESLITSELFGHEKGAFTGAVNRRIGRFELANKGTLFLDEIGDLSLEVQARLLRVLQSKEFERVGGGKEILTSDFRLIAATNRDLEHDIEAKRFREDLYYRINVVPVHMPALKDRKEDIPLLAYHFFKIFTAKYGRPFDRIPEDVMERLVRYDWPGNIRELENVIQRGVVGSRGSTLKVPSFEKTSPTNSKAGPFPTLEENERNHIIEALKMATWKIHGPGGAAHILAINPSTLASRMKKLGISRPSRGLTDPSPQ